MFTEDIFFFEKAILTLRPNSIGKYDTSNGVLTGWYDTEYTRPTEAEINAEIEAQKHSFL